MNRERFIDRLTEVQQIVEQLLAQLQSREPIFADVFQCPDSGSVGALWGASEQSRSYRDVVINGHRVDALVLNAYATSLEGLKSRLETRA